MQIFILSVESFINFSVLKISQKSSADNADAEHTHTANGINGQRTTFGESFRNNAQHGRPKKGFAQGINSSRDKNSKTSRFGQKYQSDNSNQAADRQ